MKSDIHRPFLLSSSSLWVQLILAHLEMKARFILKQGKSVCCAPACPTGFLWHCWSHKSPSLTQPSVVCKQMIVLPCLRGQGSDSARGVFLTGEASVPQEPCTSNDYCFCSAPESSTEHTVVLQHCCREVDVDQTTLAQRNRGFTRCNKTNTGRRGASWRCGWKDRDHKEETGYWLLLNSIE